MEEQKNPDYEMWKK